MRYPKLAMEIAKRVKCMIADRQMSVEEFAHLCDIDRKTMYDIVKGKHNMQDFNLLKICLHTGTPIEVLTKGLLPLVSEKYDTLKKKDA